MTVEVSDPPRTSARRRRLAMDTTDQALPLPGSLVPQLAPTGTNPTRGNESYSEVSEYTAAGLRGSVADRTTDQLKSSPVLAYPVGNPENGRLDRIGGRGCDSSLQGLRSEDTRSPR